MKHRARGLLCLILLLGVGWRSQAQSASKNTHVTAVTGESWLNHIHRTFAQTSMGKTWRLGPPVPETATEFQRPPAIAIPTSGTKVTLRGSDLYRLNCQACHGESGQGAPPEINSVINPVRATSVGPLIERMHSTGQDISRADATKMAQQARAALLQRLHDGGENMPAFPHLRQAETRSLMAYLKELAGINGAEKLQTTVNESPVRIGELIVKSTCHTCHSAVGSNPTPQQLLEGAIPPLSSLTTRVSGEGLIRKVTSGAAIAMGTPPTLYRARMPVFDYLTEQEAADVYLYLTNYPPADTETGGAPIILSNSDSGDSGDPPIQKKSASESQLIASTKEQSSQANSAYDVRTVALVVGVFLFVFLLLGSGLGFTIYECKRLCAESERRRAAIARANVISFPVRQRELEPTAVNTNEVRLEKVAR